MINLFYKHDKPHDFSYFLWFSLLFLPLFLDDFGLSEITLFFTYGLLAMSLAITWGTLGLLCLGQAIFFGIGAYFLSLFSLGKFDFIWPVSNHLPQNLILIIGLLIAMLLPACVAKIIAWLLFNGSRLDGAFLGLVTLALAVIAEKIFEHWQFSGGANGLYGIPTFLWDNQFINESTYFYLILFVCFIIFFLLKKQLNSPKGLLITATRENESRTNHLGVDTIKIKTHYFCLSAAIAGLSGGLFATQFGFVSPSLVGFGLSTEVLIWVAVGGRFSLSAAFLGAICVKFIENYLGDYSTLYWQLFLGLFFILLVIFMPKGLFGRWLK